MTRVGAVHVYLRTGVPCHLSLGTVTLLPSPHNENVVILAQFFTYCMRAGWTTTHLLYSH